MSDRYAPQDGQVSQVLAGPVRFEAPDRPRARTVAAFGLDPESYLLKAILWEVFGVPEVLLYRSDQVGAASGRWDAVVVDRAHGSLASWSGFVEWVGKRWAVVSVEAVVSLAEAEGLQLQTCLKRSSTQGALRVFHRCMSAEVYPGAPRVRIADQAPPAAGFAVGDQIHLYRLAEDGLSLRCLVCDDAFQRFVTAQKACVWGRAAGEDMAALLTVETPAGGQITVMDLRAADRLPEPSGVETLATQIFLAALPASAVTFGRFMRAFGDYEQYVSAAAALAGQSPDLASMEQIGHSAGGRAIWLLRVALDRHAPAVLCTCGIHPLEWAPHYGVLRYVRFLLEQCRQQTPYAREFMARRQFWWVLTACPDGWENRDQQESGINLDRNFPGSWERCIPGERSWDAYNRRSHVADPGPFVSRGPGPGSQPETQALMALLDRRPGVCTLVDFHETTAFDTFLHQYELPDASIPDLAYHREVVEGSADAFNGRFYAHGNVLAYGSPFSEFPTYSFRAVRCLRRLIPNDILGLTGYAVGRGCRAMVVECAGSDCTHYQTIRRTECAALAAEQVLAGETGRIVRNPWGKDLPVNLVLHRRPQAFACRLFDRNDRLVEETQEEGTSTVDRAVPAGGWLALRYL